MTTDAHRAGDPTAAADDATGQFRDSLAGKITLPALALAIVPALAIGALGTVSLFALASRIDDGINRAATESAFSELGPARAEQAAVFQRGVDSYLTARVNDVIDLSQAAEVVDQSSGATADTADGAATDDGDQADQSGDAAEVDPLTSFLTGTVAEQPALLAIDLTDATGGLVASTEPMEEPLLRDQPWWLGASEAGAFVGPPTFDPARDSVVFDIAVRVTAPTGEPAGVVHAVVDGGVFESLADDLVARGPAGIQVLALSSQNVLLSETATEHQRDRIGQQVSLNDGRAAVYADAIDPSAARQQGVTSTFLVLADRVSGASASPPVQSIDRLGLDVPSEQWVAIVEQPAGSAYGPLQPILDLRSDLRISALALAFAVLTTLILATGIAYLVMITVARRIIGTVADLQGQAEDLAHGELEAYTGAGRSGAVDLLALEADPIEIDSQSELAGLARSFNAVRTAAVHLVAAESLRSSGEAVELVGQIGRRFATWSHEQNNLIETILVASPQSSESQGLLRQLQQSNFILNREANGLLALGREPLAVSPRPVQLAELLRAAAASVTERQRVDVQRIDDIEIDAEVAIDLRLLVAELIDNATAYSPADERVEVFATIEPDEVLTISIVDRGPGLSRDELGEANAIISAAGMSNRFTEGFGLLIVGRLAARAGFGAYLLESTETLGVAAKVIVPRSRYSTPADALPAADADPSVSSESDESDELTDALRSVVEQAMRSDQ